MNDFFWRRDERPPFKIPPRVYALLIDGADQEFMLFDAVDAEAFDAYASVRFVPLGGWRDHVHHAPVYAIEVNASEDVSAAKEWLFHHLRDDLPEWSEIELFPDSNGEAQVYNNIAGPAQRARITVKPASSGRRRQLQQATDLTPNIAPDSDIANALPTAAIEQVFVLDVGQGAANTLVASGGRVVAYVDLGAGVLKDVKTWPPSMAGICLRHDPTVILTHWHYDHFHAANIFPAAQGLTWIAPLQTLGPGPQSVMATSLGGRLKVWSGHGTLSVGRIDLERCKGSPRDQNRSGIAVWIRGPGDPILLPGDAGYSDMPMLVGGQAIAGFAVAHHGGRSPGNAPARPGVGTPRAALSYGYNNGYGHPLTNSLTQLRNAKWSIGHPAAGRDERRTEDRPGGKGGSGLGHVRLDWTGGMSPAHGCTCGCTLNPTQ